MVEHANLIDTQHIHEPKGIKESGAGEVYVSTVDNPNAGPWGGEWRKLRFSDLDYEQQSLTTQEYSEQKQQKSITSSIISETTGSLSQIATFADASKNDQELYLIALNLLERLYSLENTVNKLKTSSEQLSAGVKKLGLFTEG